MRRNPPAKWALPETIDPENRRCIEIEVPDDPAHIAAFRGALLALASAYNWADDPTHKAKDVALIWRAIVDAMTDWGCALQTKIRVDDICTLSWSYDDWVTFDSYDPSDCIIANIDSVVPGMINQAILDAIDDGLLQRAGGQSGPTNPPLPGTCTTHHVVLNAGERWLIPSPVNTGDTIEVSAVTGGWSDGTPIWYCPDGSSYVLGECYAGGQYHEDDDPLNPDAYHMELIGGYGVTPVYFNAQDGIFTIPTGNENVNAFFQTNDASLNDNSGQIEFDVEICTGGWTQEFDFVPGVALGWVTVPFSGIEATISAGGWHSGQGFLDSHYNDLVQIKRTWASGNAHITHVRVEGSTSEIADHGVRAVDFGGAGLNRTSLGINNTIGAFDVTIDVSFTISDIRVYVNTVHETGYNPIVISKITLYGDGAEPTW